MIILRLNRTKLWF